MIYSTKKLKEAKKKQKQDQQQSQKQKKKQKQSSKTALNLNGVGGEHAFSDVHIRRLKTYYSLRLNTYHEIKQVPTLRLMGNWLREAEFEIGDYNTLLVSKGLIVIRKEEKPED